MFLSTNEELSFLFIISISLFLELSVNRLLFTLFIFSLLISFSIEISAVDNSFSILPALVILVEEYPLLWEIHISLFFNIFICNSILFLSGLSFRIKSKKIRKFLRKISSIFS